MNAAYKGTTTKNELLDVGISVSEQRCRRLDVAGRRFQKREAATGKARLGMLERHVDGTTSALVDAECRVAVVRRRQPRAGVLRPRTTVPNRVGNGASTPTVCCQPVAASTASGDLAEAV